MNQNIQGIPARIVLLCFYNLAAVNWVHLSILVAVNIFTAKRDCSRIYCSLPNVTTVEI